MIAPASQNKSKKKPAPLDASVASLPPLYSAEAEKAVIGSMLGHPESVIDQSLEKLHRDDFFVPAHQELFEVLKEMHSLRQAIDIMTVHQHLSDRKMAEAVGSPNILAELATVFATHLNVATYIKIVKEKSLLRHLQLACLTITQLIHDTPHAVNTVMDSAQSEIFRVTNMGLTHSTVPAREEIDRALALVELFRTRKGHLMGIPTGFYKLNELTTGWHPGDMVVLAARPGMGKTALALTFARHAMNQKYDEAKDDWVKPGYGVGMFSLEMTNSQLMLRLLASATGESLQKIRRGELDEFGMQKLRMGAEDMKSWPLYLDDSSDLTIHQLRGKARRMKERYNIDMLVIDYLQLLRSDSNQAKDSRQNEVAEISRGIKALAKELSIPVVVLAQLNRKAEEGKTEPALHNLRESGAIEQDADMVLLLHRIESSEEGEQRTPSAIIPYKLKIAKQRNGPTDDVLINFNAAYTRFEDPVRHEARAEE
jgi:replicative DNA helicase